MYALLFNLCSCAIWDPLAAERAAWHTLAISVLNIMRATTPPLHLAPQMRITIHDHHHDAQACVLHSRDEHRSGTCLRTIWLVHDALVNGKRAS